MSATNTFENALLLLIYNNSNIANIGDATGLRGSSAAGSFYIALFTADPGESGSTSNEATYTSYARVAVARTSGGFTVTGNSVANAEAVVFPACTGGTNTITHFAVMTASSGGTMLFNGATASSLAVSNGITPQFGAGALTSTAD